MNLYKMTAATGHGWACVGSASIGDHHVLPDGLHAVFDQLGTVTLTDFLDPFTHGMRKPGRLADCMGYEYVSSIMCISDAADRALASCHAHVKRVPAIFRGRPHALIEVQIAPGTADLQRSICITDSNGKILALERCAFTADAVQHLHLFVADVPGSPVFATDQFVAAVRKAELTGFSFTLEWTDQDGIVDIETVDYERRRITGLEPTLPAWASTVEVLMKRE